jgi:hypothetical protein
MGVRYEWADDRQIIMNVYLEYPWTWAEYNAMMATLMPMLGDLKHPCATVVDCSHMRTLPSDGNVLHIFLNVEKMMPANLFASVIVAAPQLVGVFMNILMRLRPRAAVLALFSPTMAEAHEKIYARYQELSVDSSKGQ